MSASYLNAASDSTDKMSESEISQEGDDLSDNITQILAAKTSVKTRQTKMKYLIGCIYRAPEESLEVFDYLNDVMKHATNNSLEVIVISVSTVTLIAPQGRQRGCWNAPWPINLNN